MPNEMDTLSNQILGIEESFEISDTDALDIIDGKTNAKPEDITPIEEGDGKKPPEKKPTPAASASPVIKEGLSLFEEETPDGEEPPVVDKTETPPANDAQEGEDEGSPFASITKELVNMGIFTLDENEEELDIQDAETFANRWELEKKKGVVEMLDDILSAKGEDKKEWFEAIVLKGVDPKEYVKQQVIIDNLSTLDLTKENNQERVVRTALKDQGFDEEDVEAKLQKIKQYGDLEDESKRYHKVLLKKEATALEQLTKSKEQEAQQLAAADTQYKTTLTQLLQQKLKDKEFDGIPLTPKMANEAFDFLYTKKYKLANGELITDFDKEVIELSRNPELKLKMGLLMKLVKTDPTLSTIVKKGSSKKSNELFNDLATQKKKTVNKAVVNKEPTSWFQ